MNQMKNKQIARASRLRIREKSTFAEKFRQGYKHIPSVAEQEIPHRRHVLSSRLNDLEPKKRARVIRIFNSNVRKFVELSMSEETAPENTPQEALEEELSF